MRVARAAVATDPGRKRRRNEDTPVCKPPLFAIADGMGGAQAGELASRLAAAALGDGDGAGDPEQRVVELIRAANRRVYERAAEDDSAAGMGTTMTVALVAEDRVAIGHVGDSRAYLIRGADLEQLTDDHSLVAELVRSGRLSPEEAETHPQRSVITRVLGPDPDVDVDVFSIEARTGDLFLLCSDGLTSMVADERILEIVSEQRDDLERAARELVKAANRGGGEDNITVIFFEVAESADPAVAEPAEPSEDDETTLEEDDAVPTLAPATPAPSRRRRRRRATWVVVAAIVLLLVVVTVGAVLAVSRSHFVGATSDGHVAVYQGLPFDLGGGVHLYREVYVSPLLAAQLTQQERRRLFDHDLQSENAARADVRRLEQEIGE
jgi:protein phosphatase